MKKSVKILFFVFAAIVFAACSSDDDNNESSSSNSLVGGYWIPNDVESYLTKNPTDGYGDDCYEFTDESHGYLHSLDVDTELLNGTKIGEKTIAGNKYYYVLDYNNTPRSFTYTVTDNVVTVTYTSGGYHVGTTEELTFKNGTLIDEYTTWVKFK